MDVYISASSFTAVFVKTFSFDCCSMLDLFMRWMARALLGIIIFTFLSLVSAFSNRVTKEGAVSVASCLILINSSHASEHFSISVCPNFSFTFSSMSSITLSLLSCQMIDSRQTLPPLSSVDLSSSLIYEHWPPASDIS